MDLGFELFKKVFSRETNLLVTLGDFGLKTQYLERGIYIQLTFYMEETKIVWNIIRVIMRLYKLHVRTRILRFELKSSTINKISIFSRNFPHISRIHKNCKFSSISDETF